MAGAAILAGAATFGSPSARAEPTAASPDEAAMAVPRTGLPQGGAASGVPLPTPLAPSDVARIRNILTLQRKDAFADARQETDRLGDTLLLGHILADRFAQRGYQATAEELRAWLRQYIGLPDALAVHARLLRKLPKGADAGPAPSPVAPIFDRSAAEPLPEDVDPPLPAALAGARRAAAARALFVRNRDAEALATASAAFRIGTAREQATAPGYVAGLAAWRLGRFSAAREYFESAARAPVASPSARAAAAFWAARANTRLGDGEAWEPWMRMAAREARTFYGMIASRSLGLDPDLVQEAELLSAADMEAIAELPGGRRAFALLQVGETASAEAELRGLWPAVKDSASLTRAMMLVARVAGFTEVAADLATHAQEDDGRPRDLTRFPVPKLSPRGGFIVDPPLVYALARLESNFDPRVVSHAGARGLMQLMPVTAGYIGQDPSLAGGGRGRLHEPALNLQIGQRYLHFLSRSDGVGGDLVRVLASYNSGTGSFVKWDAQMKDGGDPLMYVEAIPNAETRAFVQHVLTYSWIYADRLQLPSPSLDALASGRAPRFEAPADEVRQASVRLH